MSPARRRPSDLAASARARLAKLSREHGDEYAGVRVRLEAHLASARIPMQVDVGFGDIVTPAPARERYPTLLDHPPPHVLVQPPEAVGAEKLEEMVSLGVTNSRMKDFYDVRTLASSFAFQGSLLSEAIRPTFGRRGTPLPAARPLVLTREFLAEPERQAQWRAFLRRSRLDAEPDAGALADALGAFLGPPLRAIAQGEPFAAEWPPGGPWQLGASARADFAGEKGDVWATRAASTSARVFSFLVRPRGFCGRGRRA